MQRFALPVSGRILSIVGPIDLALMVGGFASGALCSHNTRLIGYVGFCTLVIAGAVWQALRPGGLLKSNGPVLAEYGLPVLAAYVLLFTLGRRTRIQATLVLPCLVLLFLTGGYRDFAPLLFVVLLLIAIACQRETEPGPTEGAPVA